jgi:hypothetical protein
MKNEVAWKCKKEETVPFLITVQGRRIGRNKLTEEEIKMKEERALKSKKEKRFRDERKRFLKTF